MFAKLNKVFSPDINDLKSYRIESESFSFLVQASIGSNIGNGEDIFDFIVCSPKWLESVLEVEKTWFGKGYLFMNFYTYDLLINTLSKLCQRTSGNTWNEIATKLSRYGLWEYEGYKEFDDSIN